MPTRTDRARLGPESRAVVLDSPVRSAIAAILSRPASTRRAIGGIVDVDGLTAGELASELDLHVTTVRFHLDRLERAGLVRSQFTTAFGVGRPRKVYAVTAEPESLGDREWHLRMLAGLLSANFTTGVTPQEAGEQWIDENVSLTSAAPATTPGAWIAKLGELIDVLQRWGYSPELRTTDGGQTARIDIVDCPFRDLARENPDVVCGIHRGLLTGVLAQLGEDEVDVSLQPFVGPRLCRAVLTTHRPLTTGSEVRGDDE
jgi:predicted ArsR family transcriptional regulator